MMGKIRRLGAGLIMVQLMLAIFLPAVQAAESGAAAPQKSPVLQEKAAAIHKVRLTWPQVPDAVMYDLVVTQGTDGGKQPVVAAKQKVYTNGVEMDTSRFDVVRDDLQWQVQALDIDGRPLAAFTELKPLVTGEADPQAPLPTTEFAKMDYAPLYPVYSWIPYLNASEYEIQVFYDEDNEPKTPDKLIKMDWVKGGSQYDYYDSTPYAAAGTYWWHVRAKDAALKPISAWSERSYFTVTHKDIKVAALGDSITHGGGAVSTPPGYLMYNWETYAGVPVLNMGYSGNTVEAMKARFAADVLPFSPKILVIMGGINNIRAGDTADQVIPGLNALKYKCILNRITPVFVTVAPINPGDMEKVAGLVAAPGWKAEQVKINEWIAGQQYHVDVTPYLTDWRGWLTASLTTDGLHPDSEGKRIIGQTIGSYIKETFGAELGAR